MKYLFPLGNNPFGMPYLTVNIFKKILGSVRKICLDNISPFTNLFQIKIKMQLHHLLHLS